MRAKQQKKLYCYGCKDYVENPIEAVNTNTGEISFGCPNKDCYCEAKLRALPRKKKRKPLPLINDKEKEEE